MSLTVKSTALALSFATMALAAGVPTAEAQWGYRYGGPYAYGPGDGYYGRPYVYAPRYAYAPPVVVVRPQGYPRYARGEWRGQRQDTGLRAGVVRVSPNYDRY